MGSGETNSLIRTSRGTVSSVLLVPPNPIATFILAHGAGANMRHTHMQSLAEALLEQDIATRRFNFPFMESGKRPTDNPAACLDVIGAVIETCLDNDDAQIPLWYSGHSFGGRMGSHYIATHPETPLQGMVYFSFPLHPSGKSATDRADHMDTITVPQLFVSGTRDALADPLLLRGVVSRLPSAVLHEIETADHGFRILKRTRTSTENVYSETARVVRAFIENHPPEASNT